jgi:hypothetical protein
VTQRVLFSAALGAILAGAALVACTTTAQVVEDLPSGGAAASSVQTPEFVEVAEPTAIRIPKIGASSELDELGLNADGSLQVPPVTDPLTAGYYAGAKPDEPGDEILPGERGSAVVAAHVDGVINGKKGQPGLFFRLHELVPGDPIYIDQADGGKLKFLVERVESHDKDAFPSGAVYQASDVPRLNLVTCFGPFNGATGHYVANLVIFAVLAPESL